SPASALTWAWRRPIWPTKPRPRSPGEARRKKSFSRGWRRETAPLAAHRFPPHLGSMSDRPPGAEPPKLVAVLGPTNTGKTHLAVERMLGHASGMIGLPLRLLAREIYDRIVRARGPKVAALITGEEKIVPPTAQY